jgi:hypothetical protein
MNSTECIFISGTRKVVVSVQQFKHKASVILRSTIAFIMRQKLIFASACNPKHSAKKVSLSAQLQEFRIQFLHFLRPSHYVCKCESKVFLHILRIWLQAAK